MKNWAILLISALTDGVIVFGTGYTSAMVATGSAQIPSTAVLVLSAVTALVAFARTVQQGLKASIPGTGVGPIMQGDLYEKAVKEAAKP